MDPIPARTKWYYGIGTVLISLFLFGPLAFPLLWKSPRFNRLWKILITIIITAVTVYLLIGTWALVELILREFKSLGVIPA